MTHSRITIKAVDIQVQRHRDVIVLMHAECFGDTDLRGVGIFREGHWWIAYDGAQPVAYAGMVRSKQWCDTGYLCAAGVMESHRGHGLQRRLIKVRLAFAKRIGWAFVITDTRQNPPSANSLIGCGFRMYDPRHAWSFRDACYWRRKL